MVGRPQDAGGLCPPCRHVLGPDETDWTCDHTVTQVNLAMALGRWLGDDEHVLARACNFIDEGHAGDVQEILRHVEGDENTVWTVESRDDIQGANIEVAFAVNGMAFLVEFAQEGPGQVVPAEGWTPECDYCDEKVETRDDRICAACKAEDAAEGTSHGT